LKTATRWVLTLLIAAPVAVAAGADRTVGPAADGPVQASTGTGAAPTLITVGFGPHQVWHPAPAAINDLHGCPAPVLLECVRKAMERHGASKDAFEFYHLTGWFLGAITNTGSPVKLATVFNPWLVNENEQPALVGGHPAVVYPADVQTAVESDPAFKALRNDFPQLLFWKSGPILETSTTTDTGQIFVFRYRLLDGCHACAIRGSAHIQFAFAPDGTYRNDRLLRIERQ
jgi:hypothetical protein